MLVAVVVAGGVVFLLLALFALLYNRLVRLRNKADAAWHQIDVQLKRRYDLLPELARVVKGYAEHEQSTFESLARARAEAMGIQAVARRGPAEDNLTGAAANLVALVEKYPDLKANQEFLEYQKELATTEGRIAGARKYYNGSVMYYDNARQGFPGNIIARAFPNSFTGRDYFEIEKLADREVPAV